MLLPSILNRKEGGERERERERESSLTFGSWSPSPKDKPVPQSCWSLHLTDWCGGEQVKDTAKTKRGHRKILIKIFLKKKKKGENKD